MLALGEDPAEFNRLRRSLLAAFRPGDVLWAGQVEDLANLYWRRARLQRARAGMLRRELAYCKFGEERRQQEAKRCAFAPDERLILEVSLSPPEDSAAGLKQILAYLEMLREQVKKRDFQPRQKVLLEEVYGGRQTWRTSLLRELLRRFADTNDHEKRPGKSQYEKLVGLLEEEIVSVREDAALLEREEKETALAERDACLAPEGKQWTLLLRQENALDRAIDRKVRILISLRDRSGNGGATEGPPDDHPLIPSLSREGKQGEARTRGPEESEQPARSPAAEANSPES
jgi:hypothetical protein